MKKLIVLLSVLFLAGCNCGGNSNQSVVESNKIKIHIDRDIYVTNLGEGNAFQNMEWHTLCIDGVNYLYEYYKDGHMVKYNPDGTISTCGGMIAVER